MTRLQIAKGLLLVLAAAQFADVLSTKAALMHVGTSEANPLIRQLMQWLGQYWWLPKIGLAAFFAAYALRIARVTRTRLVMLGTLTKVYALVILSNLTL